MSYESNQNSKETYAKNRLDDYTKDWKIFIDTYSMLHFAADKFWMNIIPFLRKYQNKVIIPQRSVEELKKLGNNKRNPELAEKAKNCLKVLTWLIGENFVERRGEKNDSFVDNLFQVVFTKFRMTHKLLLITQNGDLAKDILALNNNNSGRVNSVHVKRINRYGFLSNFDLDVGNTKCDRIKPQKENNVDKNEVFRICKTVTLLTDSLLKVTHIPTENEIVYTASRETIKLKSKVAAGGEGIIYTTNTPYVAKIYKKENNTKRRYEKIKLMLSKNIKCEGICYPVFALYNSRQEFVGYMMPQAKGKELQKSIFIKQLFLKNFPRWKKRDTVELCITILEKIKYLHDRNIVMGDINPANILVVSPKEVYFVDTDSYQVEDFPCPVGTNNYTAPEIQRKHFSDFLRTMGNENFAVATLLFMIMLPGKPPYSQQGGEDPINNIIRMDFSYPFGDNSNKKTPDGPWRYIWSHLTYALKGAFYNTFRKGGKYSTESKRLTVNDWLSLFLHYLDLLDSGKFGEQDKMSEELFPTRHKKNPKIEYVVCRLCHNEVPRNQCQQGMCQACLKRGEVYRCKRCNKEMLYTNYQKYIKKSKRYDVCHECFEYGQQVWRRCACIDCGRRFNITNYEYEYYEEMGFDLPKRCKSCREAKKTRSYSSSGGYSSRTRRHTSSSHSSSSSGSKGSSCFISTVVCEYFGKSDDCIELNILRGYRDNWLNNQPDGPRLIAEYYNNAPLIVSKLKVSADYEVCCNYLWDYYLHPCLMLIENQQYELCKKLYMEMYQYLKDKLT